MKKLYLAISLIGVGLVLLATVLRSIDLASPPEPKPVTASDLMKFYEAQRLKNEPKAQDSNSLYVLPQENQIQPLYLGTPSTRMYYQGPRSSFVSSVMINPYFMEPSNAQPTLPP